MLVVATMSATQVLASEGPPNSGFLSDYSLLKPSEKGQLGAWIYVVPNAVDKLKNYHAGMVDQPVFAVAADSKYKGFKPDDAKFVADAFRQVITTELGKTYTIVEQPGPGVLALRTAFSNVYVEKKGRGLLGYTPVGFVVTTAKGALLDDLMDKVKLTQVVVEAEVIDSVTGEVLAEIVEDRGEKGNKKEHTSWKEVEGVLTTYARRLACNIENAKLAAAARKDCTLIVEPASP
jgi:hypothetical protein